MVQASPRQGKSPRLSGPMRLRAAFLIVVVAFGLGLSAQAKHPSPKVQPSAMKQMQVLKTLKAAKSPVQNKIDSRLFLGLENLRNPELKGSLPNFRFVKNEGDGRVPVEILLKNGNGVKAVTVKLESLGEILRSKSRMHKTMSARVRLENLEAIAALPEVLKVRQSIGYIKHVINTSQGDTTHAANAARAIYSTTGAGVTVGVISDGVDSLASLQGSGDLPPACTTPGVPGVPAPCSTALVGQEGSGDEGSAMMEIIHDLAPGANIVFATADPDEAQFAQNILDLAAAGCNIIVDDIIYVDESPFQDGPVAQAVNTVTTAGVLYFSSAGNEGNVNDGTSGTWEGDFLASAAADPAPLAGANLNDFGDGGNSLLVTTAFFDPPVMLWAEHFDLATGNASTDFDIYDMDGALTTIFDASTDVQDGAGGDDFPFEWIPGGTLSGERLLIDKFAAGTTSSVPMINLIVFRGEVDSARATPGATRGHSSAAAAFSVAATPAAASFDGISADGPFPGVFTSANESENFTSDGPRRIILDPTGVEITPGNRTSTGGVVRQKPDITAADGVSTAAPTFDPFYGTSAAAPHAAAIAALIKSAVPLITPAALRTALISSAIDIEIAGTDRDTGAGIVMAPAALAAAGAPAAPFLAAGTAVPTQSVGDGDAFVENNEIWNLTIPLTNTGGGTASAISGTLSTTTPGITITSAVSTYPNLNGGASANNNTPYTFLVTPSVPCGTTIEFTLTVTYTGGSSPQSFDFTIKTGEPGTPVIISYVGPVVPIPDAADLSGTAPGAIANAILNVAGVPGNIYDINFRFDGSSCSNAAGSTTVGLDHSFVSDLHITLTSPNSTAVLIADEPDGSGNNFCQTVLDDEASAGIQGAASGSAPFTGSFTPNLPLGTFDTEGPNGNWTLSVQDFFSGDTGNIRAFSLIITPAICNAPPLTADVSSTKTVSAGPYTVGGSITYTVTLNNTGNIAAGDNPGNEFTDVLPACLTLVSANSSSGTAVASVGINTVTWNGSIPASGSVTITINATINACAANTTVTNQGTTMTDSNGDGVNDDPGATDDPGTGTPGDGTAITVAGSAVDTIDKTVSGSFTTGGNIVYTIVINNTGDTASPDNAGNELSDVLPASLTLVSASATSGTAVASVGTNTVTWNGSVPASGSVTITINATIEPGHEGETITNTATLLYDNDGSGVNDTTASDSVSFDVTLPIPAVSTIGLMLLALLMAAVAFKALRG
jgi:uncharacterized repeat protein (TIGR01451 family)